MKCEAEAPGIYNQEPIQIEWFKDKIPVDLTDPRLTKVDPGKNRIQQSTLIQINWVDPGSSPSVIYVTHTHREYQCHGKTLCHTYKTIEQKVTPLLVRFKC